MIAADLPAKWMWRMNHDFIEAKMFLCTQIMDEARHAEVFRKRALANGGGLLVSRGGPTSLSAHHHRGEDLHPGECTACICSVKGSCSTSSAWAS